MRSSGRGCCEAPESKRNNSGYGDRFPQADLTVPIALIAQLALQLVRFLSPRHLKKESFSTTFLS